MQVHLAQWLLYGTPILWNGKKRAIGPTYAPLLSLEYEEFKVHINALVAKAQKVWEEGWTMQGGTPWPGNNVWDHLGMIQVFLGHIGGHDTHGNELPRLVYASREKRHGFNHHKKVCAMNSLVRVLVVLTNAPYMLNLDCGHYIKNSKALSESTSFLWILLLDRKFVMCSFPRGLMVLIGMIIMPITT